jgi:hypothetical protein
MHESNTHPLGHESRSAPRDFLKYIHGKLGIVARIRLRPDSLEIDRSAVWSQEWRYVLH